MTKTKYRHYIAITLSALSIIAVSGCKGKMASMDNEKLVELRDQCYANSNPAPAMAQVCENVKKECLRRRKEEKNYSC